MLKNCIGREKHQTPYIIQIQREKERNNRNKRACEKRQTFSSNRTGIFKANGTKIIFIRRGG